MFNPREEGSIRLSAKNLHLRDTLFDVISYLSVATCTLIILIAFLLSLHPLSKQETDRVSYRIMIYALCGSIVYSVSTVIVNRVHNQKTCSVGGSFVIYRKPFGPKQYRNVVLRIALYPLIIGYSGNHGHRSDY
ncbi:hypothetical protein L218DRAFT_304319 [Marasmius fiardii PR-910]|nr:hypothetical protein L218DRAFT_304319 [Marasmius fiardii PR-910]